jgi:cytochrome c oxidase assembly protein Cox11
MLAIITIIAMALLAIGFASFLLYDVFFDSTNIKNDNHIKNTRNKKHWCSVN